MSQLRVKPSDFTSCKNSGNVLSQFKKNRANKISSVKSTNQNRLMIVSNCAISGKKKSRTIKNQEPCRLELH